MNLSELKKEIGEIDIYLLDQILKNRYTKGDVILDAGCGMGRNLKWFYQNNFKIFGVDLSTEDIDYIRKRYVHQKEHFSVQNLEKLNFIDKKFNHVVCNAVLHFAKNEKHFYQMFSELIRVLKYNGTIFIRTATINGMEKYAKHLSNGIYELPDGTERFLLTDDLRNELTTEFPVKFLEPYKFVNVDNKRAMSTLVLQKSTITE